MAMPSLGFEGEEPLPVHMTGHTWGWKIPVPNTNPPLDVRVFATGRWYLDAPGGWIACGWADGILALKCVVHDIINNWKIYDLPKEVT